MNHKVAIGRKVKFSIAGSKAVYEGILDESQMKLIMDNAQDCEELGRSRVSVDIEGTRYSVLGCGATSTP